MKKAEWMKEYRKKIKPVKADLRIEEREKLDEILKIKKASFIQWLRDHINKEYEELKK